MPPKPESNRFITKKNKCINSLQRFHSYLEASEDVINIIEVKTRLASIELLYTEFDDCQTELEMLNNGNTDNETRDRFDNLYFGAVTRAKELIEKNELKVTETDLPKNIIKLGQQVNLPLLNLPHFGGKYNEYTHFRDTFDSLINKNHSLDNVQKFHYLLSCLDGEALNLTQSLEITHDNYQIAWELLKDRYDNKKLIINSHVKAIFDLPNVQKDNVLSLRSFLDTFNKSIRALRSLREPVNNWDTILLYLLNTKLDFITRREWENSVKNEPNMPTINQFCQVLNSRCQFLETLNIRNLNINSNIEHPKKHAQFNRKDTENKSLNHVSTDKQEKTSLKCYFCKLDHALYYCQDFLSLSIDNRKIEAKRLHLCSNCLRPYSQKHTCQSTCKICHKTHNTLLHSPQQSQDKTYRDDSKSSQNATTPKSVNNISISAHCRNTTNQFVLLSTANIYIQNKAKQFVQCRALLDSCSQSNFITTQLANTLKLDTQAIHFPISGIGEYTTNISEKIQTKIKSTDGMYTKQLSFLVIPKITGKIPSQPVDSSQIQIPDGIPLADEEYFNSRDIDVLLSAQIYYVLLASGQIHINNNVILQNSRLGWLVTGTPQLHLPKSQPTCMLTSNTLENQLEKFWVLEDIGHESQNVKFTKNELYCENHFINNYSRDNTGRFSVALPFKQNCNKLTTNFELARQRFYSLENKIHKDNKLYELYVKFMREYIELGHMTKLHDSQINSKELTSYLPHHGVIKPTSTSTKLRVVFDASAKDPNNLSLNEVLHVGPTIQDDLFAILLRFRKHNYILKADITKMYRQVNIHTENRNVQRILWREQQTHKLEHYVLNTITYGTSSAPFLAIRTLQEIGKLASLENPIASQVILQDFYVDDLLTGSNSIENAIKLKTDVYNILQRAGFILSQWTSNSDKIIKNSDKQQNFSFDKSEAVNTLGVLWNPNTDAFEFKCNLSNIQNLTKRSVLSLISQIFDPLGMLGPIVMRAKFILQQLWKMKLNWDDKIPLKYHDQFLYFFSDLTKINQISIPRHVLQNTVDYIQVHGFTDASEIGYGACIYVRSKNSNNYFSQLLCSKSRVAPVKTLSIPRLELCSALLLAKLINKVTESVSLNISTTWLWTDSKIVLAWLAQEPSTWKTFVSSRVSKIQHLTKISDWYHVSSTDNPADLISRGCNSTQLSNSRLWWTGPIWLNSDVKEWPISNVEIEPTNIPEARKNHNTIVLNTHNVECFDIFNRYSELNKLIRITAWCIRVAKNHNNKNTYHTLELSIEELEYATKALVKIIQNSEFQKDLSNLSKGKELSKDSKIKTLNPFLDNDGIIRVGGRLKNSNLPYDHKHQMLLPGKHKFTELVIIHYHKKTLHGGVSLVLSALRSKFWPIKVKNQIKKIVGKCIPCFRANPKTTTPLMGQLPASRVTYERAFSSVGIDFAGPFMLKEGTLRNRKLVKAYIAVFICFTTKAVHLELVGDLSTPLFLNALKRFFARRGISKNIWTDNGSNFVGSSNELKNIHNKLITLHKDHLIQCYLKDNQIRWNFIPPRAPHWGGLWESMVKQVKKHLLRSIGLSNLTYEQFYTVLTQIECILNSRPICPLSDDPNDFEILTPSHFLIGSKIDSLPEENVQDRPINRTNKYRHLQYIIQSFWKRWRDEYLHNLQQRNKWLFNDPLQLKPGLMVLIKNTDQHPFLWKMGRITDVFPGQDKVIRVANIILPDGSIIKRAFSKICVLPVEPS